MLMTINYRINLINNNDNTSVLLLKEKRDSVAPIKMKM